MTTRTRRHPPSAAAVDTARRRPLRRAARALVRSGGPLAVGVLAAAVLGVLLVAGPAQSYLDARARVEVLELKDRALEQENARLEQRVRDLHDPDHLELVAREQQGFVRPGEIAYTIIPPDDGSARFAARPVAEPSEPSLPERMWRMIRRLVTGIDA